MLICLSAVGGNAGKADLGLILSLVTTQLIEVQNSRFYFFIAAGTCRSSVLDPLARQRLSGDMMRLNLVGTDGKGR
jgi:hypothetical protein